MPQPEREHYHHGNLREALIDAGLALARSGGDAALTLRTATRDVGVSASAAYRHFADRDALLDAVAERIRDAMAARMRAFEPDTATGRDRLRAVGLGYIAFAREEPGWFETAFATITATPEASAAPAPLIALTAALDALVADGELSPADRPGAEWPCWSAVHGFARLWLRGPLRQLPEAEVQAAAERTVDTAIAGLLAPRA
ncbi:TetR/AcrR family transcriptional regulator [Microbacterium sp.]|uniref:TetR/AcrR family transcriptional regulator n=1 Tax=Microbacterium sp. TaxID=51671 RepID=UPI003A8EE028